MRVITADAFVGGEPDDFLGVDEHAEDVIGTERAAGAFKGEILDWFPVVKMKRPAAVSGDPNIVTRSARDRGNWPGRSAGFRRLQRIAIIKESTLFGARTRAGPKASL